MIYLSEKNRDRVEQMVVSAMESMSAVIKETNHYTVRTGIEAAKVLAELAKAVEDKPRYMFDDIGEKLMEDAEDA